MLAFLWNIAFLYYCLHLQVTDRLRVVCLPLWSRLSFAFADVVKRTPLGVRVSPRGMHYPRGSVSFVSKQDVLKEMHPSSGLGEHMQQYLEMTWNNTEYKNPHSRITFSDFQIWKCLICVRKERSQEDAPLLGEQCNNYYHDYVRKLLWMTLNIMIHIPDCLFFSDFHIDFY